MTSDTDISELKFIVSGIANVVHGIQTVGSELQKAEAAAAKFNITPNAPNFAAMQAAAGATAKASLGFIGEEISLVQQAIEKYEEYGKTIRNIQNLSGGSIRQSEQFANISKVAGLSPNQSIRELTRLAQDQNNPKGRAALASIGVTPGNNELETMQKVITAFQHMQNGAAKTRLEIDLLGRGAVTAFQGVLDMNPQIAAATNALNAGLSAQSLQNITDFQQSFALLGQTVETYLVYPIADKLLPALSGIAMEIHSAIKWVGDLDKAMHGALSWGVIIGGVAAGFVAFVVGVNKAVEVIKGLQVLERVEIGIQTTLDALKGPAGWAAIGVAVAVGGAAYMGSQQLNAGDSNAKDAQGNSVQKFSDSVASFGDFVKEMKSWSGIAGSQLPSNFTERDYAFLQQQRAMGAVG